MAFSAIAASRTVLVIGPRTSRVAPLLRGAAPPVGTSPCVVLTPTRLCAADGFWMDPPVSSPMPHTAMPAATAVAVPVLLAPGTRSALTALKVRPSHDATPPRVIGRVLAALNGGMLVLPSATTPASSRRCTSAAFCSGYRSTPPAPL